MLGVSYRRVMKIVEKAEQMVAETYRNQGVVCPPTFEKGIFLTGAADNLDHDPSLNSAKTSFHCTVHWENRNVTRR